MKESHLERKFRILWEQTYPDIILEREKRLISDRRFRFDFVYRPSKVAIEINGGVWGKKSGHNSGQGIERDYEKANLAQTKGWIVFQLSGEMINSAWLKTIYRTILKRKLA